MYKKGNLFKKTFWFTFLFLVSIELFAQHHISGKIVDNNHQGLPLVNVAFLAPKDSTLITGCISAFMAFSVHSSLCPSQIIRNCK